MSGFIRRALLVVGGLLGLVFVAVFVSIALAAWNSQTSANSNDIYWVYCPVDANTCYATGDTSGGQTAGVQKTTDGGSTWSSSLASTTQAFRGLDFPVDNTTGYVVGNNGQIMKTTNSGGSWSALNTGTTSSFTAVDFADNDTGYVVANGPSSAHDAIIKTTDGSTWASVFATTSLDFTGPPGISCTDTSTCYVAAAEGADGIVLKTTNGGTSWTKTVISSNNFFAVHFPAAATGYIFGHNGASQGVIYKTTDSGSNWTSQSIGVVSSIRGGRCFSATSCRAVGVSGTILVTSDGTNWSAETSGTSNLLRNVHFPTSETGYAVGASGTILKFTTPSTSTPPPSRRAPPPPFPPPPPPPGDVNTPYFNIFINNNDQLTSSGNVVLTIQAAQGTTQMRVANRQEDVDSAPLEAFISSGGQPMQKNWNLLPGDGTRSVYARFYDQFGQGSSVYSDSITVFSFDGYYAVYYPQPDIGYAVGTNGRILKTTDSGATWTPKNSGVTQDLFAVYFLNADRGYAAGAGGTILKTENGGASWTSQAAGTSKNLYSVFFLDENNGYVAGADGTILKTGDGGSFWTLKPSGTFQILNSVHFPSVGTGYIVGDGGVILKSTEAGSNWLAQSANTTKDLYFVFFTDNSTGCIIGNNVAFKTTNGGANWSIVSGTANNGFQSYCQ